MFISKYEKDELHKKIDALSLLVAQATERAQKSEEKAIELSLKISSMEKLQIQQQLKLVEALEEIEEIDGLSDDMFERIKKYESRADAMEKHVAKRYRDHDEMNTDIKVLTNASNKAATDISRVEKRFETFVDVQTVNHAKVKENMKILAADQNTKHEKISSIERSLEATRAILFGLKKDLGNNRKDLLELCKIAVTRDDPVFALDGGKDAPKTVASEDKPISTEGVNIEPLTKAPEAPYGLKKDGTPRKRPGRPIYNIPEIKNEQPLPV